MVVVETMFFDSDDYDVKTDVIPCDSKKTAKAVVEKVYNEIVEDYIFDDDEERKQWENEMVKRKEDGSIFIQGGDCGYACINIIDKEPVLEADVENTEIKTYSFY